MQESRQFIVTGAARSGTRYMSQLLTACGVPCTWEGVFDPSKAPPLGMAVDWRTSGIPQGDSSWFAVPFVSIVAPDVVFHQTRNPVRAIRSLAALGFWKTQGQTDQVRGKFVRVYIDIDDDDDLLTTSMKYWLAWNRLLETNCAKTNAVSFRYRIEDTADLNHGTLAAILSLIGREPDKGVMKRALRSVNTKAYASATPPAETTWADMPDGDTKEAICALAHEYGYSDADLEAVSSER